MMYKLKPCPFCTAPAKMRKDGEKTIIACTNCTASVYDRVALHAYYSWNTRLEPVDQSIWERVE